LWCSVVATRQLGTRKPWKHTAEPLATLGRKLFLGTSIEFLFSRSREAAGCFGKKRKTRKHGKVEVEESSGREEKAKLLLLRKKAYMYLWKVVEVEGHFFVCDSCDCDV
jgi:hypothetical protein